MIVVLELDKKRMQFFVFKINEFNFSVNSFVYVGNI